MNTLKMILSGSCLLFSLSLFAQKEESAPDLPYINKVEITNQVLESLFLASGHISLELAPGFRLEGIIQSRSQHGGSVVSILMILENGSGGTLSISRYLEPNGHIAYAGHLLKLHEPAGMMLVERDQRYFFIETQQRFLVAE